MTDPLAPRLEVDGRPASLEQVWGLDRATQGHFTAMQVRDRATLGMAFHLARLDAATRELFGVALAGDSVRDRIRHALADDVADASVRVHVYRPGADGAVTVMVSVRPPAPAPSQGLRLQSFAYQRPAAHIKQISGFGQSYFGGLAHANGFDEALFVAPGGAVAEGSITNIAFLAGDAIVWPDAPALRGIMMQVLQRELDRAGVPWRYGSVRLDDLGSFDGAFLTNSHGLSTVACIDGVDLPMDTASMRNARGLLDVAPYDPI